jgi:hypothetical protein
MHVFQQPARVTSSAGDYIISPGPLNTNRVVIGRGILQISSYTTGNDPTATSVGLGAIYFNQNTNTVRLSNGTVWLPLATVSGTPATGNCASWLTATQLQDTGAPCGGSGGSVSFPLVIPTGLGAITQITGPSDQDFIIQAPRRLILKSTGGWPTEIGPNSNIYVGASVPGSGGIGDVIDTNGAGGSKVPLVVPMAIATGMPGVLMSSTPVKADTTTASSVTMATTSDTGPGIVLGVCVGSGGGTIATGGTCYLAQHGAFNLTLGTGSCSIGQYVIVDTTTNGRVKCTSTYTPGAILGVAMAAQSTVGSTFSVLLGLR